MQIEHTDIIEAAPEEVYRMVKDELPQIARHLPNIERIDRKEAKDLAGGKIRIVNHWFAQVELP